MGWFRRSPGAEPLPVTMAGVRLGDRFLAVGMRDPALIAALAVKAGLTGRACAYDADADRARNGATAVEREGALVEAVHAPWGMLPYDADSFDVAVARDVLMILPPEVRARCLSEVFRVLRPGGRLVVIEPAPRGGFGALLTRTTVDADYVERGGAVTALTRAGFSGARVLATRDGTVYVEGAKRAISGI